jgi:Mycothiol maleylpyruvate isomerase N-terminal domain
MKSPTPIHVADLFPELRVRLLDLLAELSEEDWKRRTAAPLWSVKHL